MKKITFEDVKSVLMSCGIKRVADAMAVKSDTSLLSCDMVKDLHMSKGSLVKVICLINGSFRMDIPVELYMILPDYTINSLVSTINLYNDEYSRFVG